MEISARFLKLNAEFEIPNDLEIGRSYPITLDGSVTHCIDGDDEKGGLDRVYRYKAILGHCGVTTGHSIPLKDRRSASKRFRSMIMTGWGNDEDGYQKIMNILMAHGDDLREWVTKRF